MYFSFCEPSFLSITLSIPPYQIIFCRKEILTLLASSSMACQVKVLSFSPQYNIYLPASMERNKKLFDLKLLMTRLHIPFGLPAVCTAHLYSCLWVSAFSLFVAAVIYCTFLLLLLFFFCFP